MGNASGCAKTHLVTGVSPDSFGEPVADIRIRSAQLKGINIPEELVPLEIDEFPVIFIAAGHSEL